MVTLKKYQAIAERFGHFASWAVWEKAGYRPKSNIADMGVFDSRENPALLDMLNPEIVMVALNFSRKVCFEKPFMNFHDANPYGQDYKIRFAFEGTDYYGAYMTDIIKKFPMLSSKHVLIHLKNNPEQVDIQ
jgi:RimJ/RimL family protein N-acetyltransferase